MIARLFQVGQLSRVSSYKFGLLSEYTERANKKLHKGVLLDQQPQFFTTSARPGNFGEHLDFKANIDNWFDENRVHNEHETDIRRSQLYAMTAVYYGGIISFARVLALGVIGRLNGWKRYDRDSYLEVDISELPPGEVMQIVWNGMPVFIRRITLAEVKQEEELPKSTILDPTKEVFLQDGGNTKVLVVSAICTHLGCIPIPYLGSYNGWVCICHGSVYDKYARVRQGPALENLPCINNSLYDDVIVCIEEMKFPREPSVRFWT